MSSATAPLAPVSRLRTYASFVRFEHTLFSLPLLIAGVFSARGPSMYFVRWIIIIVAAVAARIAAMSMNRLIDRRIDALNPRTRSRELPAGRMKSEEAWTLLLGSVGAYVAACQILGTWYLLMSPIPLVVFATYPYLKRFTPFCHFGVGLALALAPLAGYAAAHPDLSEPLPALILAGFALLWVSGFDIIYATLDEEFDRSNGIHSMVAWLGRKRALLVSGVLHALAFVALIAIAMQPWMTLNVPPTTPWALPGMAVLVAIAGGLLFLEQRWAENVNLAFFKVNVYVGFVVLAIVLFGRWISGGFGA